MVTIILWHYAQRWAKQRAPFNRHTQWLQVAKFLILLFNFINLKAKLLIWRCFTMLKAFNLTDSQHDVLDFINQGIKNVELKLKITIY